MRKKLIVVAVAVVIVSLAAYGTMAYLSAEWTAHNVITAGTVQVELLDKTKPDGLEAVPEGLDSAELVDYPNFPEGGMRIMPGTTADKLVAVRKLADSSDCWVRVRLDQTIQLTGDDAPRGMADDPITLALDEANWLPGETDEGHWDGWYYYTQPLTDDAPFTTQLLSKVHFGPDMGNAYQGAEYIIRVTAQAVQFANNEIPADGDVTDINGWPALADGQ